MLFGSKEAAGTSLNIGHKLIMSSISGSSDCLFHIMHNSAINNENDHLYFLGKSGTYSLYVGEIRGSHFKSSISVIARVEGDTNELVGIGRNATARTDFVHGE